MGPKKSQRTKNNAKPSSSGRSAELLEQIDVFSFGFSTLNDAATISTPLEFQVLFKKMNKKDPITKQKALQEFAELCASSGLEQVTSILHFWPRLYNILAIDNDLRVREATQIAHKSLVCKIKKQIAPVLKEFIGTWYISTFELRSVPADIAKSSFQEVFPPHKRVEVILFCKNEILKFIANNLINATPESLSNSHDNAEEMKFKYQRIIVMNLIGYTTFIEKLSPEILMSMKEENVRTIINTDKFWKFSKHQSRTIKAPWFTLIITIITKAPYFLETNLKRLCCSLFDNIDDADTSLLPIIWESVIKCYIFVPDWWKYVNVPKVVLPKLCKLLSNGINDDAVSVISNYITTFLIETTIPESISSMEFYSKLLHSMIKGLSVSKMQKSSSEIIPVVGCFFNVLHYLINEKFSNNINDVHFLVDDCLITLIRCTINDAVYCNSSAVVAFMFSHMVRFWKKNAAESDMFAKLYTDVWSSLQTIFTDSIGAISDVTAEEKLIKLFDAHYVFIGSLLNPFQQCNQAHNIQISFAAESNEKDKNNMTKAPDKEIQDELIPIVNELITLYLKSSIELPQNLQYVAINSLCRLLILCKDEHYVRHFLHIWQHNGDEKVSPQLIYDLLKQWTSDKKVEISIVIKVVFYFLSYVRDEEQSSVLTTISEQYMSSVLEMCYTLLNDDLALQTTIRKWLNSPYFKNKMHSFVENLITTKPVSREKLKTLKFLFNANSNGSYVDSEMKTNVLNVIKNFLSSDAVRHGSDSGSYILWIGEIMEQISADTLFVRNNIILISEIVLELYKIVCDFTSDSNNSKFSDDRGMAAEGDTINYIDKIWISGLASITTVIDIDSDLLKNITYDFAITTVKILSGKNLNLDYVYCLAYRTRLYLDVINRATGHNEDKSVKKSDENAVAVTDLLLTFVTTVIDYFRRNIEYKISCACRKAVYCLGSFVYKERCFNSESLSLDFEKYKHNRQLTEELITIEDCFIDLDRLFNFIYYMQHLLEIRSLFENDLVFEREDLRSCLSFTIIYEMYMIILLETVISNFRNIESYTRLSTNDFCSLKNRLITIFKVSDKRWIDLIISDAKKASIENGALWSKTFYEITKIYNDNNSAKLPGTLDWNVLKTEMPYGIHTCEVFPSFYTFENDSSLQNIHLDEDELAHFVHYLNMYGKKNTNESETELLLQCWIEKLTTNKCKVEMTYNKNLLNCDVSDIVRATIVCRFFSCLMMSNVEAELTIPQIDFIIVCLAQWTESIKITCSSYEYQLNTIYSMPISIFICSVCRTLKNLSKVDKLHNLVNGKVSENGINNISPGTSSMKKVCSDWNNLFAKHSYGIITDVWKYLADSPNRDNVEQYFILNLMSDAVTHITFEMDFDESWIENCSKMIANSNLSVRITACDIFSLNMAGKFVQEDMQRTDDTGKSFYIQRLPFDDYRNVEEILEEHVCGVENGGRLQSYFLMWTMAIKMIEKADVGLRFHYVYWLKTNNYMPTFLNTLCALLLSEKVIQPYIPYRKNVWRDLFICLPEDAPSSNKLVHIAFNLYYQLLLLLPVLVRQWWNLLDAKTASKIDKITTKVFSPLLINEEIKALKTVHQENDKFSVKGFPVTKQIICSYTVDQTNVQIKLTLPPNHPLGITKVEADDKLPACKLFLLLIKRMAMLLNHQNGIIKDALLHLKSNMDKVFQDVEECYICLSIIHNTSHELPKQKCNTCHKKFHGTCMYRWFLTSNNSTCPICRGVF